GLFVPFAIATDVAILQAGRLDGAPPGTEMLPLGSRGGELRVHFRAHVPPGEILSLGMQFADTLEDSVARPGFISTDLLVIEPSVFNGCAPGPKIAGRGSEECHLILRDVRVVEVVTLLVHPHNFACNGLFTPFT